MNYRGTLSDNASEIVGVLKQGPATLYRAFNFFFQAEDGIRDLTVTGVQTCALPISRSAEFDRRLLFRDSAAARGLDEHRAADAAQSPPFQGSLAPLFKGVPFGAKQRLLELAGRVAAVVGRGRRLVGERLLRNQVAPAQFDAVDAALPRRLVDQPLHQVGNARPPRAAVC